MILDLAGLESALVSALNPRSSVLGSSAGGVHLKITGQ